MNLQTSPETQVATFDQLVQSLRSHLQSHQHFTLQLVGEQSQFIRFNRAKVRQTGWVQDGQLRLTLMQAGRVGYREFPFTGRFNPDWHQTRTALTELQQEVPLLPEDPYLVLPAGQASSREIHQGKLLDPEESAIAILSEVSSLDFTGIYAAGSLLRGYADSAGQQHWFATDLFSLDYSLFTPTGQSVKGTFADSEWRPQAYIAKIADSKQQLERLSRPARGLPKGQYRSYLAPTAVADLINMFSWGGVSEAAMQRGGSALALLQREEKALSPQFHLSENFQRGLVPRFNDLGEIAPVELPLIQAGKLVNTLVSSRTAKEYGIPANGATAGEYLRSPELAPGSLSASSVLAALDTGLYISNLHYLNWSDRPTGRITGMTRYACFWVEQGEIVAPIENLRFDESLYRCFGDQLIALTTTQEYIPEVGTYEHRQLGGVWAPGALIEDFTYTL